MNTQRITWSSILATLMITNFAFAQDKEAVKALQGKWQVTKMIKRGQLLGEDQIRGFALIFDGDKVTIKGNPDDRTFSFKVNAKKMPGEIDFTAEGGPFKGQTVPGIYRFDAGVLTLCLPHDNNKTRPDAFESLGGVAPSRILWTLKRPKD